MGQKTIYICDRCGREMDPPKNIVLVPIGGKQKPVQLISSIVLSDGVKETYLCEECAIAFWKFMRKENKK